MKLLVDTHAFLWFVLNDPQLSQTASLVISIPANEICISPATYWELAIKVRLGKYQLRMPFQEFIEKSIEIYSLQVIPILPSHTAEVARLPLHHRDPFDRMLIAQAIVEQLTLVSSDAQLDAYPINRIW